MGKIAIVFPGQGAQYPGMGRELAEDFDCVAQLYQQADEMRPGTSAQCFEGSKEELSQTINTQPCLFLADLASGYALRASGITPDCTAGFSLGEAAALAFSGAMDFKEAFAAVCSRAQFMQQAAQKNSGSMAAVLGVPAEKITEICARLGDVFPVNFNCPGQTVIAGSAAGIESASALVKEAGGRAVRLNVSGAFHSPFMEEAARQFYDCLGTIGLRLPEPAVYANATAQPYGAQLRECFARQIKSPVLWQKTIENMIEDGVDTFIEAGPGKVLCGLIKKTAPDVRIYNVEDRQSLETTVSSIRQR